MTCNNIIPSQQKSATDLQIISPAMAYLCPFNQQNLIEDVEGFLVNIHQYRGRRIIRQCFITLVRT